MTDPAKHSTHPALVVRLKRAEGHLRSVIGMIEQGRPCADLAQQLHAVEAAVGAAKRELIHDHIDHCLETRTDEGEDASAALRDLKAITKYL
jgi:DNA-binding FrmR family transcriptional regulator